MPSPGPAWQDGDWIAPSTSARSPPTRRFALKGQRRLLIDTVLLGIVGALGAQLFIFLVHLFQNLFLVRFAAYQAPGLPSEGGMLQQVIGPHGLWLIPVATTLGGLVSGALVYHFEPDVQRHGIDAAIRAFHREDGVIRPYVAPLELLASAITIGSGGAAGPEGPTGLIAAGVGSIYGVLTHRSPEERRLLVLIGLAAGLSAIFRSPIGTALFAVEVLYSNVDFDGTALLYTMLGSVVAYAVNGPFVGWQPLFNVAAVPETRFVDYFWYAGLGLLAGAVAAVVPVVFCGLRDAFHALPVPRHLKPGIGGLAVGLMALELPQVLGYGYGWIQEAMDGRLAFKLMLVLVFAKLAAFALTVSSGGSGGVFAPTLFVGGMLGGAFAAFTHQPPAAFVVLGMAATFGGAARVPIATLWMVTEMTGGYRLLVPAALAVAVSVIVQVVLTDRLKLKYFTLYEAQVPSQTESPVHMAQYLEVAMKLLERRQVELPPSVAVDLRSLLAAGVPVRLTGGDRFMLGALPPGSSCAGRTVAAAFEDIPDAEIVAVFRQGRTLLAHPGVVLEPGDRMVIVARPADEERIRRRLGPPMPV